MSGKGTIVETPREGNMKLSVIIPCYNAADTITAQLEALASQRWSEPWEVIVVDNRSSDESMVIVEQYLERLPNLRVVDASARQGQPYALNVGARTSVGDALAFCDADDEVGTGWVAAMGEALSKYDFVACRFDIEKLNAPWVQESHENPQRDGLNKYRYPPYLPHAGGGSLGVKRSLHEAIGGFDESLPLLHDTDYCWRIQLAGTELHFVPDAVIHVRYRDTLGGIYRQARGYAEYNVLLYKRYQPLGMPRLSWKTGLRGWVRLLKRLPRVHSKNALAAWVWQFGWRIGRLKGCFKYGILAP
jgi:glycosyltransferase involved in cell wall biosynthesis